MKKVLQFVTALLFIGNLITCKPPKDVPNLLTQAQQAEVRSALIREIKTTGPLSSYGSNNHRLNEKQMIDKLDNFWYITSNLFEYDSLKRIKQGGYPQYLESYKFFDDKIVHYFQRYSSTDTLTINKAGFVTSSSYRFYNSPNSPKTTYEYDSEGNLIR